METKEFPDRIAGMGTGGAAVATALSGVTVAGAAPVIVGGAVSIGAGILVSKQFKRVRRKVKARQEQRRLAEPTDDEVEVEIVEEAVVIEMPARKRATNKTKLPKAS